MPNKVIKFIKIIAKLFSDMKEYEKAENIWNLI